jgi:hypothetical protein
MNPRTELIPTDGVRVAVRSVGGCAHGMPRILAGVHDRIRRVGWLCLWLIARHATRLWIASE